MALDVWESLGTSPSRIQKGFCETVADVMNDEVEGEDETHPSKRPRVGERVPVHVPSNVEPQNRDFNVNEFLRSSPNPFVGSVFGDSEIIQRAAVRRDIPSGRPFSSVPLLLEWESALMENERHS